MKDCDSVCDNSVQIVTELQLNWTLAEVKLFCWRASLLKCFRKEVNNSRAQFCSWEMNEMLAVIFRVEKTEVIKQQLCFLDNMSVPVGLFTKIVWT